MPNLPAAIVPFSLALFACSQSPREDPSDEGASGELTVGESQSTSASSSGDGTGSDRLDVADGNEGGGDEGADPGCEKVDLLFVVDNSESMSTNQALLAESAPGFVEGIRSRLTDVDDYHVGVVTSDAYSYNQEGCQELGALVTQTGGGDSSDQVCSPFVTAGARYLTEADNLEEKFPCILRVGTWGLNVDELMMGAATNALLNPTLTGAGGCNEGFHRKDSLLVLVFITDEPEYSEGDPMSWYSSIVGLKGLEQNVVVISLTWQGYNDIRPECSGVGRNEGIEEFSSMFTNGVIGDVCLDYADIFSETIGVVKSACDDFIPVE